ncbi:MAG: translation initiation factor IF-6 [archaeon]
MKIKRKKIKGSPFIGVFGLTTERIGLFPRMDKKERKKIEDFLEVEVIETTIGNSNLIGVLTAGNKKGFVVGEIVESDELRALEQKGVNVKVVPGLNALGNLIALNDYGGILSRLIPKETAREIKNFFKIPFIDAGIANTEIVGSCIACTNKGFIVNPGVTKKEMNAINKVLKVKGSASTVNYGDPFVSNGVIANSKAVFIGEQTSGYEIIRIDDGLGGE